MSNAVMPLSDYKDTCDKIREKTNITDKIKSGELADKVNEVYEKGKQAEYDNFWDNFQSNGTRKSYYNAFYGSFWKDEIFKPKYDIIPTNAYAMFNGTNVTDLVETANNCGIVIDFSNNTNFTTTFAQSTIKKIGVVDTRSADTIQQTFYNAQQIQSIEKVILNDDGSQTITNPFNWNYDLEEIRFEGVIGGSMTFGHATKLSKASIQSIVSHLSDTTSGKTLTLNKTAVNNAFETVSGTADGSTSEEWLNLVASKPNWTISLS